jgi:hypothetical protein
MARQKINGCRNRSSQVDTIHATVWALPEGENESQAEMWDLLPQNFFGDALAIVCYDYLPAENVRGFLE